ncbi:hypothetical protein MAR_009925 [Mya arenaria]|uniref:Uncharacterized protein n=1 Tax=Mya arenaria TaxID=6604 RepID=A0ABY7E039_MYAAR|nr:hypothetical protein MAR_009925 [Mya arenaria]
MSLKELIPASVSCLLMVAGLASPGWFYYKIHIINLNATLHVGLWYTVECSENSCDAKYNKLELKLEHTESDRMIGTLAVMFCIIAVGLAIIHLFCTTSGPTAKRVLKIAFIWACVLAGVLGLTVSSRIADEIREGTAQNSQYVIATTYFPYSLVLHGVGASVALATTAFHTRLLISVDPS